MREIITTKFIAEDGSVFDNIYECEDYEREHIYYFPHIHIFDFDYNRPSLYATDEIGFIVIKKECPAEELENFKKFYAEYDVCSENIDYIATTGVWAWDVEHQVYKDLGAIYKSLEQVFNIVWDKIYKEKEGN